MKQTKTIHLYQHLADFIELRQREFDQIPLVRKKELMRVADYIRRRLAYNKPAKLTFICTHNSRRSHFSQIWAQVAADVYGLEGIQTFSGGTEATAFNPKAVASLVRSGLQIDSEDASLANPVYKVRHADDRIAQECYSKVFNQPPNPVSDYCAVMTCSQADDACPLMMGCDLRAPIRYDDPKTADGTPQESTTYDERSRQICREMLFMMSQI